MSLCQLEEKKNQQINKHQKCVHIKMMNICTVSSSLLLLYGVARTQREGGERERDVGYFFIRSEK